MQQSYYFINVITAMLTIIYADSTRLPNYVHHSGDR